MIVLKIFLQILSREKIIISKLPKKGQRMTKRDQELRKEKRGSRNKPKN